MRSKVVGALLALSCVISAAPVLAHHEDNNGDYKPSRFRHPTDIDNDFYPLESRMQLILDGHEFDGFEDKARRLVITVSDVVKTIDGVKTLAVSERDYVEDNAVGVPTFLREDELTFVAQDRNKNVWRFAEYPEEFDEDTGLPAGAPNTWITGQDGAIPGLYMRGRPLPATPPYSLVFAPGIPDGPIDDQGEVLERHIDGVCVPAGCFDDVIKVREQNILVPSDCCQIKYHAKGVGNIKVEPEEGDEGEFLELVEVRRISRSELHTLREEILALDERAYDNDDSATLWDGSHPAHRR